MMENQLGEDMKVYPVCRGSHQPSFKILYNMGDGKPQIELICAKCIQDPAYLDGILSMWCYNCRREHNISLLMCCNFVQHESKVSRNDLRY